MRVYLVLRVRRACNHRGTAKRPLTPSHSASRHSIFFSFRRLARPCRCPGTTFLGPVRLLMFSCFSLSLFLSLLYSWFSSPRTLGRFAASCRCAHSIIIIGFRSQTACVALLPFRFPFFSTISVSVRLCTHYCTLVSNSITLHYELANESAWL